MWRTMTTMLRGEHAEIVFGPCVSIQCVASAFHAPVRDTTYVSFHMRSYTTRILCCEHKSIVVESRTAVFGQNIESNRRLLRLLRIRIVAQCSFYHAAGSYIYIVGWFESNISAWNFYICLFVSVFRRVIVCWRCVVEWEQAAGERAKDQPLPSVSGRWLHFGQIRKNKAIVSLLDYTLEFISRWI